MRRPRSPFGILRRRNASSMLRSTVSQGNSAASWKSSAGRPSTEIVPLAGRSRPAMRLSSVVLPQPDAPTRQRNSPARTSREMRSRAKVWAPAGP